MEGLLPPRLGSDRVIVGYETSDDAAVVRLDGDAGRCLVVTTDTIAPLVDEPEDFGAIAAANALSDVYAMGGRPLCALNLVFFPTDELPLEVLRRIMHGAQDTCAQVGVPIVGGHSVCNPDLKFGLAVTGEVATGKELSNRRGRPGDVLVLTKALGTGIVGTAIKKRSATADQRDAAVASMRRLNDVAIEVGLRHGVSACTDVTGFGLLGHLRNVARGSHLDARVVLSALPLLPGALELAREGHVPGGSLATLNVLRPLLHSPSAGDAEVDLRTLIAADAQTSGGLLLCLSASVADAAVSELREAQHDAAIVGELLPRAGDAARIEIEP